LQIELLKYLKIKFSGWNRISVERVVSGKGICNVYDFLAYRDPTKVDKKVHKEFLSKPGNAQVIAENAVPGSLCGKAIEIFCACYGSQCGAVAIQIMPFRGLFITGGVSKQLQKSLADEEGAFMGAYYDKGRVSNLLTQVPLFLVMNDDMGQRGAHLRSVRLLHEYLAGKVSRVEDNATLDVDLLPPPAQLIFDGHTGSAEDAQNAKEMQALIRNRRMKIDQSQSFDNEPVFKSILWRVGQNGNAMDASSWVDMDMWISKNGNFAYKRWKTNEEFVYATKDDLVKATITMLSDAQSAKPWSFTISIPGMQDSILAAESSAAREYWIYQLEQVRKSR
jgi:glucokinase